MASGHALVVGGTGMLQSLCLQMAGEGWVVSVVARNSGPLADLSWRVAETGGTLIPLAVDYADCAGLAEGLKSATEQFGPIDLVVAWMRSANPAALTALIENVSAAGRPWKLFHLKGSTAAAPGEQHARPTAASGLCSYREIVLGFKLEPAGSRWLTDDEIVSGVLSALASDAESTVIGTVTPWEKRP